jgi:DNA-binding XRE family transcriptional regulator
MKDRIKEIMESKHMTQKVFAQYTGINEGTLSLLLRDKAQPTLKTYEAIHSKFPDVSMEWLFDGTGSMYKKGGEASGNGSQDAGAAVQGSDGSSTSVASSASSPALPFGEGTAASQVNPQQAPNIQKTVVKIVDKPQRKITEIRVFFDDQTWESFVPKKMDK